MCVAHCITACIYTPPAIEATIEHLLLRPLIHNSQITEEPITLGMIDSCSQLASIDPAPNRKSRVLYQMHMTTTVEHIGHNSR